MAIRTTPTIDAGRERLRGDIFPSTALADGRVDVDERTLPIDLHVLHWFGYQIKTPRRFVRLIMWVYRRLVRWYMMARSFLVAELGPRIEEDQYEERQVICRNCEFRYAVDMRRSYCTHCGCPRWLLSRLKHKNRLLRWSCPERRHPGTYIEWKARSNPQRARVPCGGNGRDRRADGG